MCKRGEMLSGCCSYTDGCRDQKTNLRDVDFLAGATRIHADDKLVAGVAHGHDPLAHPLEGHEQQTLGLLVVPRRLQQGHQLVLHRVFGAEALTDDSNPQLIRGTPVQPSAQGGGAEKEKDQHHVGTTQQQNGCASPHGRRVSSEGGVVHMAAIQAEPHLQARPRSCSRPMTPTSTPAILIRARWD